MLRPLALVALALVSMLGCASKVTPASPPPRRPAPATQGALHGALLLYSDAGVMACRPECKLLSDPALARPEYAPRRIGKGRYLFVKGIYRFADGALEPLPPALGPSVKTAPPPLLEDALWPLASGAWVHVEHHAAEDRLSISKGTTFVPLRLPVPRNAYEYRFLPDGRHLFKVAPLMGRDESPHFVDVIPGQIVTLSYAPTLGGPARTLVGRSQTMHADFVGAHAVYWAPGEVDTSHGKRTLRIESVALEGGGVTSLGAVVTPTIVSGAGYARDTPYTEHHPTSRFFVHGADLDASSRARSVRVVDVPEASASTFPLADGEEIVTPLQDAHAYYGGNVGRRDDDVTIVARSEGARTHLRVIALSTLATVLEIVVPSRSVASADFVAD